MTTSVGLRTAFWKGAAVSGIVTLLASAAAGLVVVSVGLPSQHTLAAVSTATVAASPRPTTSVPAPTVPGPTVTLPGPTVTLPGPERTVTIAEPAVTVTAPDPATAAALQTCRTAVTDGDKALNNYIRNIRITSNATLDSNRLGDPGPMNAATAQLQATSTSDRAQYGLFAAGRDACLSGR